MLVDPLSPKKWTITSPSNKQNKNKNCEGGVGIPGEETLPVVVLVCVVPLLDDSGAGCRRVG